MAQKNPHSEKMNGGSSIFAGDVRPEARKYLYPGREYLSLRRLFEFYSSFLQLIEAR